MGLAWLTLATAAMAAAASSYDKQRRWQGVDRIIARLEALPHPNARHLATIAHLKKARRARSPGTADDDLADSATGTEDAATDRVQA